MCYVVLTSLGMQTQHIFYWAPNESPDSYTKITGAGGSLSITLDLIVALKASNKKICFTVSLLNLKT